MKKMCIIGLIFSFLVACTSPEKQIETLQGEAEEQAVDIAQQVRQGNWSNVFCYTKQDAPVIHVLFDTVSAIYWTSNTLNIDHLPEVQYGGWKDYNFDNAQAKVYWTDIDSFQLMTIVPTQWHLHGLDVIENSISYQPVRAAQEQTSWWQTSHFRVHVYFVILVLLFVVCLVVAVWMVVSAKGWRNLHLQRRIQLILSFLVLSIFLYLGVSIVRFERKHYEERQREQLQDKCRYVQAALQQMYYNQLSLSSGKTMVLNSDLRLLGQTYGADIHVYDFHGRLVGSSTPGLFDEGLLNRMMDAEVFFSKESTQVKYEHLGQVRYLAAFTEFVNGSNTPIGYIGIPFFISEGDVAHEVEMVMSRLLPPFILMLILTLAVSSWIAQAITRPIRGLIDKMQNFALGQDNHITYLYNDEIGKLVKRYNILADELEQTTRKLIRSEREGAWRTMARQIAHEINNPLTPMKLTVQQLQRLRGTADFEDKFNKASQMLIEQIDNLSRIATSFSTFAKLPQVVTSEVDIAEKLLQAIMLQQNNSLHIPIRYLGPDSGLIAMADREQIGQVFTNILKNAIQALENSEEGDIIVILKDQDTQVEISVSDNGPGIPQEIQSKVFMPNFTTKSNGTGLGLAISKNIVEGSDGTIRFETSPKGTTFYIYLHKTPIV